MNKLKVLYLCGLFALINACGGTSAEDKAKLEEAHEIQEKVIAIVKELDEALEANPEAGDALKEELHEIEESLFEIPGYHLELPGHEGHDHSHSQVELGTDEILAVQKELLKQVEALKKEIIK